MVVLLREPVRVSLRHKRIGKITGQVFVLIRSFVTQLVSTVKTDL